MSDVFLMVVPEGYIKLLDAMRILEAYSVEGFRELCKLGAWGEIDGLIEAEGQLPAGQMIEQAIFVEVPNATAEPYQVWMKFMPVP
jgi:hypothetical protein